MQADLAALREKMAVVRKEISAAENRRIGSVRNRFLARLEGPL
jgi:hypothetical protein